MLEEDVLVLLPKSDFVQLVDNYKNVSILFSREYSLNIKTHSLMYIFSGIDDLIYTLYKVSNMKNLLKLHGFLNQNINLLSYRNTTSLLVQMTVNPKHCVSLSKCYRIISMGKQSHLLLWVWKHTLGRSLCVENTCVFIIAANLLRSQ